MYELHRMLSHTIRNGVQDNPNTKALIIHVMKQVSRHDMKPLFDMLKRIRCSVPVYIIQITESFSRQIFALSDASHNLTQSGTIINQSDRKYIVYINDLILSDSEPRRFLYPIQVAVSQIDTTTQKMETVERKVAVGLINHFIQLSRLNFQTVQAQPLAISVKPAMLIAEKMAYMNRLSMPSIHAEQQWYW